MKKIFTLIIGSLFSLSLLAFDGSRLSVSTVSNSEDYKVEVDGRKFSLRDNAITLSNLSEGYHQVKIFREGKKRNGNDFGFNRNVIIYSNQVLLKRGFHLDITLNRFGKALVDERKIDRKDDWYDEEDDYYDNNSGGWNNTYEDGMNVREFESVKESLRKEWFENNRMTSTKFIIDKNNFSTTQVRELMLLFTFENNRLEIAKYAYKKTLDKNNYYQLNDALTYSNSKDELARFIRQSR
ncbi:MAG: DUF4476 domain-containing protein [Chitinophagaceae bacterium]